jgi:hypothetical protein
LIRGPLLVGSVTHMNTLIVFNAGHSITVTEPPEQVGAQLSKGWASLTQVGPLSVNVNGANVAYIQHLPA